MGTEFHGYGTNNNVVNIMLKAFKNGTNGTGKMKVKNKDNGYVNEEYRFTKDFTAQGPIKVTGWFSGHIHDDCYAKVDGINYVVSTCCANSQRTSWANDRNPVKLPPERNDTDKAMSINVFIVNKDTRTVSMIKIGSKRDNTVRTSSDLTFTY